MVISSTKVKGTRSLWRVRGTDIYIQKVASWWNVEVHTDTGVVVLFWRKSKREAMAAVEQLLIESCRSFDRDSNFMDKIRKELAIDRLT